MSTNPFLKPRETKNDNTRFGFIESSSKLKQNSNKKHIEYDSSRNSFTKRHIDEHKFEKKQVPKGRFSNEKIQIHTETKKTGLDVNDIELFPDLVPIKNTQHNQSLDKFKEMLNSKPIVQTKTIDNILPGWIKLSRVDKKLHIEHGPLTMTQKQRQLLDDDLNYVMTKAIERIEQKNFEHERAYDAINGEGTFREKFGYVPTYGSDYDTETETDSDEDENDDNYDYNPYEYLTKK